MITIQKLSIYKKYSGDVDGWARQRSSREKKIINDEEWALIENLVQDNFLVTKGLASKEFAARLDENLRSCCDTEETIRALKAIRNG